MTETPKVRGPKIGLPFVYNVKGSAEKCATFLFQKAQTVYGAYRRSAMRDSIIGAVTHQMEQLVKVTRPTSEYTVSLEVHQNVLGFELDTYIHETPDACPRGFESMREFELDLQAKCSEVAHDHSKEAEVLALIAAMATDQE